MSEIVEQLSNSPVQRTSILVCVNDTDHSRVAVKFACSQARKKGCEVTLLNVIEPADYQGLAAVVGKMEEDKRNQAEAVINDMAELAKTYADIMPILLIREGDIGKQIIKAVNKDHSIGMVILGSSPETPGRGSWLSSLASKLGKELLIPLVIIPGNLTEQQIEELM